LLKSVREFPLPIIKLDNEDAPDEPIAIEAVPHRGIVRE
jgi:hypothetical protein